MRWLYVPLLAAFIGVTLGSETPAQTLKFKQQDEEKAKEQCDAGGAPLPKLAPTIRDSEPNLALLEAAKAEASSLLQGWRPQRHCVEYLNDGFYNNCRSWILGGVLPQWAQIDLGQAATVERVFFGSEHEAFWRDRAVTAFEILVADKAADPDSKAATWKNVFTYNDAANPIGDATEFKFKAAQARWVRILVTAQMQGEARIDEIEIYGGRTPLVVGAAGKLATNWARLKQEL
jgi:hypothetical protein